MDALAGTPQDVKLPNRRSARDAATVRMPAGVNPELSAIRHELAAMQDEGATVPARFAATGGGGTTGGNVEDEVTTLYHELQRAAGKLEVEKAQRKRAEAELESIRQHRLRETSDVVQELERKRAELNTLREERTMMREWLDRGVAECKRVADDVVRLKAELDSSEKTTAEVTRDKQKLANTIQQLGDELASVQVALEKVHQEKSRLELKAEESQALMVRAEEDRKNTLGECDRLSSDVSRLSQRVRGLEDAELAMQSMVACITQLVAEIGETDRAITSGDLERGTDRMPVVEAASNITEKKPLQAMVIDAKRLLQELNDATARLRTSVKRYVAVKMKQQQESTAANQAQIEHLQKERNAIVATHRSDVEAHQQRAADLEREIIMVADGVQRDVRVEAHERMAVLDKHSSLNKHLTDRCAALQAENEKLKSRGKKMKLDWGKVDDSRRRFQQLQAEVMMMKEFAEKQQLENRNLRLMLEGTAASPLPAGAGGSVNPRAGNLHKAAFDEWRTQTMSGGSPAPGATAIPGSPPPGPGQSPYARY